MPIVDITKPRAPDISPFNIDPELTPAIIVKPNIDNQKYSVGPNLSARLANNGDMV